MKQVALLIGAGKIGRGFLAHLASRSGYSPVFVDVNARLVALINERCAYRLHMLTSPPTDETIAGIRALTPDAVELESVGTEAAIAFVSVGGPNLPAAGKIVAQVIKERSDGEPLNVIVAENWPNAAFELRNSINAPVHIGIAEATILRSCIEPTPEQRADDPLSVQCQDFWELPVDAARLVAPIPNITGLMPTPRFENALKRKVYTYNALNATIAYLGYHRGHRYLADAANDPIVSGHAQGVKREVNAAICATFGYEIEDQDKYSARALEKFQNRLIVDPIERQVRDPIRKLGRNDRLVGAAMLAIDSGVVPFELALAIAAALQYRNPADPSAVRLAELVAGKGPAEALATIAGVTNDSPLIRLVDGRLADVRRLIAATAAG